MRFSDLPEKMQNDICYSIHGQELWEMSRLAVSNLDALTETDMFDAWLTYQGIMGYTSAIINVYKTIFENKEN